jgi:hypothetical protein
MLVLMMKLLEFSENAGRASPLGFCVVQCYTEFTDHFVAQISTSSIVHDLPFPQLHTVFFFCVTFNLQGPLPRPPPPTGAP